jgi:hypothetical protein
MESDYAETLTKLAFERHNFKKDVNQEIHLHDAIRKRQEGYIHILKKELLLARNIIQTPVLLGSTYKKLNFDDVEFYRHELLPKEGVENPLDSTMLDYDGSSTTPLTTGYLSKRQKRKEPLFRRPASVATESSPAERRST